MAAEINCRNASILGILLMKGYGNYNIIFTGVTIVFVVCPLEF